eukprot:6212286-Pleurochrysis_carterae.AAC.1
MLERVRRASGTILMSCQNGNATSERGARHVLPIPSYLTTSLVHMNVPSVSAVVTPIVSDIFAQPARALLACLLIN